MSNWNDGCARGIQKVKKYIKNYRYTAPSGACTVLLLEYACTQLSRKQPGVGDLIASRATCKSGLTPAPPLDARHGHRAGGGALLSDDQCGKDSKPSRKKKKKLNVVTH